MLIYATDHFVLPLPPGHRFPMAKYARLRERVTALAPGRMREPPKNVPRRWRTADFCATRRGVVGR
jgi:hypothetical protein